MKLILAYLLILVLVIFPACTQPAEAPPSTTPGIITQEDEEAPPPATTAQEEAETPPSTPPPAIVTQADVDAAREVVFKYWEAFNSYDVEGVLAFLEESYRQERQESITSDIGRMQSLRIKIGVEEEAEPTITPEGKVEIKMKIKTPIGTKHYTYYLVKINDEWKIYLSVEA